MKIFLPKVSITAFLCSIVVLGGIGVSRADISGRARYADSSNPIALPAPHEKGVPGLPGPMAPSASPASNMGLLKVTPDVGFAGHPLKISGTGLDPNANITLTWSTANATWVVDPQTGTVNYMGRQATKFAVILAKTTTDSNGNFSIQLKTPYDYGGLHDIYAVENGTQEAHGGFLMSRHFYISPKSGPIGTPITVTYTGFAPTLYEGGAALLWDNHYMGEMMANWTRGTAKFTIRAAGPVGKHVIEAGDAINFLYLNLQQASDSWAIGGTRSFTVTRDTGRPRAQIWWPMNVKPTVNAKTTFQSGVVDPGSTAHMKVFCKPSCGEPASGGVNKRLTVTANNLGGGQVDLEWATVVGTRVNCTSTCWALVTVPVGKFNPEAGSLRANIRIPNNLGGWHALLLNQGDKTMAQAPVYVKESIVGKGVSRLVLKEGQHFTIHLHGVGWTQLDNTVGVDYDNSYMGYGCGFASNGDVVLNLHATGGRGTHIIDTYPQLYTLSPSFPNTPWGLVPVLSYAQDYPGLALGYRIPSVKLAITIK